MEKHPKLRNGFKRVTLKVYFIIPYMEIGIKVREERAGRRQKRFSRAWDWVHITVHGALNR